MIIIPTRSDISNYTQQVTILGTLFTFGFKFNTREEVWTMDILEEDEITPILMGVKLVGDWKLTERFAVPRLPAGFFFTVDETGTQKKPGRDDLGGDVKLFFVETSELA